MHVTPLRLSSPALEALAKVGLGADEVLVPSVLLVGRVTAVRRHGVVNVFIGGAAKRGSGLGIVLGLVPMSAFASRNDHVTTV